MKVKYNWDYKLPKNFKPKNEREWLWVLERKINYDDFKGLKKEIVKKYFPKLKHRLDPEKKCLNIFLKNMAELNEIQKKVLNFLNKSPFAEKFYFTGRLFYFSIKFLNARIVKVIY